MTLLAPGAIGGALMAFLPNSNTAGKLFGNYLTNCIGASLRLLYSWLAADIAGHTKKITMNAILLVSFCLGNIIGTLTYRQNDAPDILPAYPSYYDLRGCSGTRLAVADYMGEQEDGEARKTKVEGRGVLGANGQVEHILQVLIVSRACLLN